MLGIAKLVGVGANENHGFSFSQLEEVCMSPNDPSCQRNCNIKEFIVSQRRKY